MNKRMTSIEVFEAVAERRMTATEGAEYLMANRRPDRFVFFVRMLFSTLFAAFCFWVVAKVAVLL